MKRYIKSDKPKSIETSSVLCSLHDKGLSIKDDGLFFKFIYDYLKAWDEYPTYEEVLDEWDNRISFSEYDKAVSRLNNGLIHVNYYTFANEDYIELLDIAYWLDKTALDAESAKLGAESVWVLYDELIDWVTDRFEAESGTNVYLLGIDGRHFCVKDTIDNVLRCKELKELAKQLMDSVVSQVDTL